MQLELRQVGMVSLQTFELGHFRKSGDGPYYIWQNLQLQVNCMVERPGDELQVGRVLPSSVFQRH